MPTSYGHWVREDGLCSTIYTKPTLQSLQRMVGGCIESYPPEPVITVQGNKFFTAYVNEEGAVNGMKPNPFISRVFGNMVFVMEDVDGEIVEWDDAYSWKTFVTLLCK